MNLMAQLILKTTGISSAATLRVPDSTSKDPLQKDVQRLRRKSCCCDLCGPLNAKQTSYEHLCAVFKINQSRCAGVQAPPFGNLFIKLDTRGSLILDSQSQSPIPPLTQQKSGTQFNYTISEIAYSSPSATHVQEFFAQ